MKIVTNQILGRELFLSARIWFNNLDQMVAVDVSARILVIFDVDADLIIAFARFLDCVWFHDTIAREMPRLHGFDCAINARLRLDDHDTVEIIPRNSVGAK